jgi:hypothetical protein
MTKFRMSEVENTSVKAPKASCSWRHCMKGGAEDAVFFCKCLMLLGEPAIVEGSIFLSLD